MNKLVSKNLEWNGFYDQDMSFLWKRRKIWASAVKWGESAELTEEGSSRNLEYGALGHALLLSYCKPLLFSCSGSLFSAVEKLNWKSLFFFFLIFPPSVKDNFEKWSGMGKGSMQDCWRNPFSTSFRDPYSENNIWAQVWMRSTLELRMWLPTPRYLVSVMHIWTDHS